MPYCQGSPGLSLGLRQRMLTRRLAHVVALSMLVLAACGSGDADGSGTGTTNGDPPVDSGGAPSPEGGLSVREALATEAREPLLVRGYVVSAGTSTRLCEELDGSSPATCGGASAELVGYDISQLDGSDGDVRWSKSETRVLVERKAEQFVVSSTAR